MCAAGLWSGGSPAQETAVVEPSQVIEVDRRPSSDKPPVITAVAIVSGGGQVATAGDDHVVRIWSTTTGRIEQTLKGHSDWVRSLAFSPDGQTLVSAGDDRRVILWQVSSGKPLLQLPPHPRAIYGVAFSPDGALLAAVGFEHKVRIYNARTGTQVKDLEGPGTDLRSVVFSPDGRQLAVAGRSGQIRVWAMPSGTIQLEIAAGLGRLRTLAYLPAGDKLVSAGEGRVISLWDAHTGQQAYKFSCPSGKVLSMTVCGENLIATCGSDNVVRIWNWQTQAEADRMLGHTGSVAALAFDPASGMIISGSFDTTVRVWKPNLASAAKDTASDSTPKSRVR